MKLPGLSLLQKGLLITLFPLLFQAALLAMVLFQQRSLTRAQELAVHTKDVLQQVDALVESLLVTQVNLRGELLGLPTGIEAASEAEKHTPAQLEKLARLVSDSAEQQGRIALLQGVVEMRRDWVATLRALIRDGKRTEAVTQFHTGEGSRRMQTVQEAIGTIRTREEDLDRERLRALQDSTQWLSRLLFSGLALDVLAAVGAMWLAARSLGRRTRNLLENVKRVNLGVPLLPASAAADELGDLDRSFHRMANALGEARVTELELQRTVESHNADLTRANLELKEKSEENEMFVYSVSHDLRSPLVNLQGFSKELGTVRDELRTLLAAPLTEDIRQRCQRIVTRDISEPILYIQSAVTRLSSIIDVLLRLSRAGRVEYLPSRVDLGAVLRRIIDALRDSIAKKGATVTVRELPRAWGDPSAIEQIFANLVVNAVNYLDPERPGVIEIGSTSTSGEEDRTIYYVRDNGLGIPTAHLPKLFAVFQRLHEKVAPGEGIGLALVRRAVERHGGKIWAESESGSGTTFYVSLPSEESSPLAVISKGPAPSAMEKGATDPADANHLQPV